MSIPIPTITRFPSYLRILRNAKEEGKTDISATALALELGLKPIQVRKDISCTGIEGKPKIGFNIEELEKRIRSALGWDNTTEAVIIGAGSLGSAIARYAGFDAYGLRIAGIFDSDESKRGAKVGFLSVMGMDELEDFLDERHIKIAVITTPASVAQEVCDRLIECGIRGVWNFAPRDLKVPQSVVLQRTDLATSFAVLSARLGQIFKEEE